MFTILAILGFALVVFVLVEFILFLLATCWWLGVIVAIFVLGGFIDWCVIKHGFRKLFGKKKSE